MGNICTAFFATRQVSRLSGQDASGWLDQNWVQLGYQLADTFAGGLYSFLVTCIILFILNIIPGLQLRADENAEILGIDDAEIGEFAYDYVELTREVINDMDENGSRYSAEPHDLEAREKNSFPMSTFAPPMNHARHQ